MRIFVNHDIKANISTQYIKPNVKSNTITYKKEHRDGNTKERNEEDYTKENDAKENKTICH